MVERKSDFPEHVSGQSGYHGIPGSATTELTGNLSGTRRIPPRNFAGVSDARSSRPHLAGTVDDLAGDAAPGQPACVRPVEVVGG
jgi:hypothetical protein